MSYNSYNQYSPYWQQPAGQTTPQSTGQVGQPQNSYQPLSAYQNNQQPSHSSVSQPAGSSSSASYSGQGYGNLNSTGSGRSQDSRPAYTFTNDSASIDGATALGNLAYASSLGRDNSLQQMANYNRQQSNANYGTPSPYGVNSTPQVPSAGSNTQAQTRYSQPARSSTEQHRVNQYPQPSRPSSGQAIQRLGSQAAPSPTMTANQSTPNPAQVSRNSSSVHGEGQTRVPTPHSDTRPSSAQVSRGPTQKPQASQASPDNTTNQPTGTATKSKAAAYSLANESAAKRMNEARQPSTVDSKSGQANKPATPVEPQYTTVDPSQVFNHIEYSRRQAAAAAEAATVKKAAEEAEAVRIAATQPKPATPQASGISASATELDSVKKDQMELEMKQMIEKMRDYKSKDPSLFTQIWEQVKKGQPPQRAPSQSLQGSATSPIVINGQLPSPSMIQIQLPPGSDLPAENEFPPGFDRGRFPAQRRKRGSSMRVSTGRKSGTTKGSTELAAGNQGSPVPPEIAIPTLQVGQIFPDPGTQSMQQAMHQFHHNSKSPIPKAQQDLPPQKNEERKHVTPKAAAPSLGPTPSIIAQSGPQSAQSAQSAQPAQPAQPPKAGGTYWPESKKKALAEAAQIALTSTQPNQRKNITTQEIHDLLDQNPSYTQMCEILEFRGFVIDRGQLARVLLKAVPDLGSSSSPTNAPLANATNATRTIPTNATHIISAPKNTIKATSVTPIAGSFGKLVKTVSNGSAPHRNMPRPLSYSVPPTGTLHASNKYVTSYNYEPSVAQQANGSNQNDGLPRDYRFVDPALWTPDERRYHASITSQGRPNGSTLQSHLSFSLDHQHSAANPTKQALDQNGTTHPNEVTPKHPTKQEMARKRTFGEIVDLTQELSDDEELERQRPKARLENESAPGPSKSVKNVYNQVARRQPDSDTTTPKPFKYKYSGRDALLLSHDIIEPMNKRRDALRRSTYNPKTIARDVLLGLGKHPTMAPLNAHLDVLKDRFKAVDYESDLSTFRWDLVDPEGEANVGSSDTDEEEAVHAVAAVARARPAPLAVMIKPTDGEVTKNDQAPSLTVDSRGKPYKRGPYKKSGVRSAVQPSGSTDTLERQSLQSSLRVHNMIPPDLSQFAYNSPYTAEMNMTTPNTTSGSAQKHRGRPPGAKNKQVRPDKGIPKKTRILSVGGTPSGRENRTVEEIKEETKQAGTKKSSSPNTPTHTRPISTTPVKPSGFGNSKSAMTSADGIAVVIPSRSSSVVTLTPQASAKKGRLEKTETAFNSTHSSAPSYTIYRCNWENCPAELHNLETLKKHVRKHRRDVDGVHPCLWADCFDSSNPVSYSMENKGGQHSHLKFKSEAEWISHVESNHMRTDLESHNVPFA